MSTPRSLTTENLIKKLKDVGNGLHESDWQAAGQILSYVSMLEYETGKLKEKNKEANDEIDVLMDAVDSTNRKRTILEAEIGKKHLTECGCPDCPTSLLMEIDGLKDEVVELKRVLKKTK